MIERGTVSAVEGTLVVISCRESCSNCGNCGEKPGAVVRAVNRQGLVLSPGDLVEYEVNSARALRAGFLLLVLPLLLFFPFYYVASLVSALEPLRVLAGLGGVAAGVLANVLLRRVRGSREEYPEVVKKIRPAMQVLGSRN